VNTALFITVLAQAAPEAAKSSGSSGIANLFIVIVTVAIFVAILVSYARGHKNVDNVAVPPIGGKGDVPVEVLTAAASAYMAMRDEKTLVAILTAAAYVTVGQPVRVVSFQPVNDEWGIQGRRDIFLSHKFR
jgi:hypothetical protein